VITLQKQSEDAREKFSWPIFPRRSRMVYENNEHLETKIMLVGNPHPAASDQPTQPIVTKRPLSPALKMGIYSLFGVLFLAAIVLRTSLYHVETSDYTVFLSQWYTYIKTHDGFAAFKDSFSNYNVPYLYLPVTLRQAGQEGSLAESSSKDVELAADG
jgi:hypothetical protein